LISAGQETFIVASWFATAAEPAQPLIQCLIPPGINQSGHEADR